MSRGKASSVPEMSGTYRRGLSARSLILTSGSRLFIAWSLVLKWLFDCGTRCFHGVWRT